MGLRLLFVVTRSGGHLIPAFSMAEAVRRRYPDAEIRFAGTAQGVEARLVPRSGYVLETIPAIGLSRVFHPDLLRFPWMVAKGICRSFKIISTYRPHMVICTGGYVSGPVGLTAWALGIPLVFHEQNSLPGLTIRLLSRMATQVYFGFQQAALHIGGRERLCLGNPVREGWQRIDRAEARKRFGLEFDRPTLLVVGGSQGARGINRAVAEALPTLMERGLQLIWQTGKPDYETASSAAADRQDRVVVTAFIDDMAAAYSAADLALTRAGAITLAEEALLGVPALLVPLPTAAENHQEYNARARLRVGAAEMILESNLDGPALSEAVLRLLDDPEGLSRMAARSRALSVPDAADRIVTAMEQAGLLKEA